MTIIPFQAAADKREAELNTQIDSIISYNTELKEEADTIMRAKIKSLAKYTLPHNLANKHMIQVGLAEITALKAYTPEHGERNIEIFKKMVQNIAETTGNSQYKEQRLESFKKMEPDVIKVFQDSKAELLELITSIENLLSFMANVNEKPELDGDTLVFQNDSNISEFNRLMLDLEKKANKHSKK